MEWFKSTMKIKNNRYYIFSGVGWTYFKSALASWCLLILSLFTAGKIDQKPRRCVSFG